MGTSLQLVDRLVPGANLESYIQAASRIPVYGPVRQAAVYPNQESPALPQQSGPTRLPATQ